MFDPKTEYDSPDSWATKLKALRCVLGEFKNDKVIKELNKYLKKLDWWEEILTYFVPDIKVCLTTSNRVFIKLPDSFAKDAKFIVTQEQLDDYTANT